MSTTTKARLKSPTGAPPGLLYLPDFLSVEEEKSLLKQLKRLKWDDDGLVKLRGQEAARREIDFLYAYNRHSKKIAKGRDLPPFLEKIRDRCESVVGLPVGSIQQVIASLYRTGAGIGWHADAAAFGEPICGVSLGSTATMRFREKGKKETWSIELAPRSLVVMTGPSRWDYEHEVLDVEKERISLTLRTINEESDSEG